MTMEKHKSTREPLAMVFKRSPRSWPAIIHNTNSNPQWFQAQRRRLFKVHVNLISNDLGVGDNPWDPDHIVPPFMKFQIADSIQQP